MQHSPWWRDAVIYQVYPRSFADGNGDGIGDLPGITARLGALADLGVDGVWISPFFTSPQEDAGYDVADYCDVDPMFGTLDDADRLIARAHELGLRIIIDIVPNHTSSEHRWFRDAIASVPGSVERSRYFFRRGRGENGELPPNNWRSSFGGSAWSRVTEADGTPGEWYLHMFAPSQPDLDWRNPEVIDEFLRIFRFWADRGVDGFRIDVAHGLVKADGLPDYTPPADHMGLAPAESAPPMWAQPEVHDIIRGWRALLNEYDGDRLLCAEAWVSPLTTLALWTREGEMQHAFNFPYLTTPWDADALRRVIDDSLTAFSSGGGVPTWVLSNHDLVRHTTRFVLPAPFVMGAGVGPLSPGREHDAEEGSQRARAATLLMLALPGSAYLYQGEELGLPEVVDLPDEARRDPTWRMSGETIYGRDGCRVPIPWEHDAPNTGFGTGAEPWLPQPAGWSAYARDLQDNDPASFLAFYREALRLRRAHGLGDRSLSWNTATGSVIDAAVGDVRVIVNMGAQPCALPPDGRVLLATSGNAVLDEDGARRLSPSAAVWLGAR